MKEREGVTTTAEWSMEGSIMGRELEGRVLHVPTLLGGKVPDLWD